LYKESFKEDNKPKIDSDLRLINAMRGKKWMKKRKGLLRS
jgi:hypothetical protein